MQNNHIVARQQNDKNKVMVFYKMTEGICFQLDLKTKFIYLL